MSKDRSDDTPDAWLKLRLAILEKAMIRLREPDEPPYMFAGYEAHATKLGGMGMVIFGRDPQLDRDVAIKLWQASGPAAEAALRAEAKTLAKLSHPNVVTIYAFGTFEDYVYFAMEYVPGPDDREIDPDEPRSYGAQDGHTWIQEPHTWQEIRAVFVGAARGLAAAHDAGILHRDFKPGNMLVGADGRTRVADFGIADTLRMARLQELLGLPQAGTTQYMAPERLRGRAGDARSDQFSFCVSMWEGLHGIRPYAGTTEQEILEAVEAGVIRGDPHAIVPHWLSRVVRKGLADDPDDRYADMHELIDALLDEPPDDDTQITRPDLTQPITHLWELLNAPGSGPEATPRTPTNLLEGRTWASWGPRIEPGRLTDRAGVLIARRTGLELDEVQSRMLDRDEPGRYLLLKQLAVTWNSAVYSGVDRLLGREVVVKIHRDDREDADLRALRESRAYALYEHPNVVQIYDTGEQDTGPLGTWIYSVMELCDGNLRDWSAEPGKDWAETTRRVIEAARGLQRLHAAGYAHGDIKPLNILIRGGVAKLADFGHARKPKRLESKPPPIGTPGYAAPEVVAHGSSFEGDVFSLAVTLWECLCGELPYPLPNGGRCSSTVAFNVTRNLALDRKHRPLELPPGTPAKIGRVLLDGIDPDPERRPTLAAFIDGLVSALDHAERRHRLRRRVPVGVAAASVTLALGIAIGAQGRQGRGGGGEASIVEAALRARGPLTYAEFAARNGDGETVIAELNRLFNRMRSMSAEELEQVIRHIDEIAEILRETSPDDAEVVRDFSAWLQTYAVSRAEPQQNR